MDDITLVAKLVDGTTVYVSPVHDQTYCEYVEADNFIARERLNQFEILAKATSLDAAREIFGMLTASRIAVG